MGKCLEFFATVMIAVSIGLVSGDDIEYSSAYIEIDKSLYLPPADKVIASIFDWSPDLCALKCIRQPSCLSLNVATEKNGNEMFLCEMLSASKNEDSTQLQPRKKFHHYTIHRKDDKPSIENNLNYESKSCKEILQKGHKTSGVYAINPDGQGAFSVYCDMETDGGGWTVLQRRQDGSVNFTRVWNDYKNGFGSLEGEFWLGNDKIHRLTASQEVEVRFDLEDFKGNKRFATYQNLTVLDENNKYKIFFGGYNGTAGDSLTKKHHGMNFTTVDRDNDNKRSGNCAVMHTGAWWFNACHRVNINGRYEGGKTSSYATGVIWSAFKGDFYSLKKTEMKIRPK